MKASLEAAFRLPRSQSPTGNACLWGYRLSLLAAEPLLSCISSRRLETRFEKGFSLS
ncbi:MAG: hypothetical protein V7L27_20585 [Nostoc sp.]|uniref:hypothetical protein n=1 Tax=Nostoc sp. TaxID=1180 RepID=UPI002FFC8955